jgi:hypothetical protein
MMRISKPSKKIENASYVAIIHGAPLLSGGCHGIENVKSPEN